MMPEQARGDLPPGQRALAEFPRIGIPRMLARRVSVPDAPTLRVEGDVASPCEIPLSDLEVVPRRDQVSDFHCAALSKEPTDVELVSLTPPRLSALVRFCRHPSRAPNGLLPCR